MSFAEHKVISCKCKTILRADHARNMNIVLSHSKSLSQIKKLLWFCGLKLPGTTYCSLHERQIWHFPTYIQVYLNKHKHKPSNITLPLEPHIHGFELDAITFTRTTSKKQQNNSQLNLIFRSNLTFSLKAISCSTKSRKNQHSSE